MKNLYLRNLILFFTLTIFLLGYVILINYYIDPGYQFSRAHIVEREISQALLNNHSVLVCVNYNDRQVKKLLFNHISSQPEVLILGSSRTMSINNKFYNTTNVFNASLTSATLEDDIAMYYLYRQRGWNPKTIVISLDPWIINSNSQGALWRTTFLSEYNNAMLLYFGDKPRLFQQYAYIGGLIEKYIQLLSPFYLIDSLKNIKMLIFKSSTKSNIINPNLIQMNNCASCHLHLPNGTRLTSKSEELTTPAQADYAGMVEVHQLLTDLLKINLQKTKIFEQFISYLLKQGTRVVFYLPPYEPAAYIEINNNPSYLSIKETERYFHDIASKFHIKIIGSYNPNDLELTSNDFIDDLHLKKQAINKVFVYV